MVVGHSGECGENVPRRAVGDELTDCDDAQTQHPNMVVIDVQVPLSKPNNVEPSSARSTEAGAHTPASVNVPCHAEVEPKQVSDTATHLHPNTTDSHAQEPHPNPNPATPTPVPSTANTHHGLNGPPAPTHAVAAPKPEAENAHHPNTAAKDAKSSVTPSTNVNATPSCVQ